MLALFAQVHAEGQTIIVVTHSPEIAAHAQRRLALRDGEVVSDERITPQELPA